MFLPAKSSEHDAAEPEPVATAPAEFNRVYYKSATKMRELRSETVDLVVTSPPYFNIKDYSKDGRQTETHSARESDDLGAMSEYQAYLRGLNKVWKECARVLRPNGKLCVNVPLMPMLKAKLNTHHNRHIFDLQADIQAQILKHTGLYLLDLYVWRRTNPTKKLMFGSYPFPGNLYAQNTCEFVAVFVKAGKPKKVSRELKEASRLSQQEWVEFTSQVWDIPSPNKGDEAFGKHSAIMPAALAQRCIRLFSFENDVVLDPFAGSGTTLKAAKELRRQYVGYELYKNYAEVIDAKLRGVK